MRELSPQVTEGETPRRDAKAIIFVQKTTLLPPQSVKEAFSIYHFSEIPMPIAPAPVWQQMLSVKGSIYRS